MSVNFRTAKMRLTRVAAGILVLLAIGALWLYGYRCAGPTYANTYVECYRTIAIVTVLTVVPGLVAWRWLMRGTHPPTEALPKTGVLSAYVDNWKRACDFKSKFVHPKFAILFLVFELSLTANFVPWLFLLDRLRHCFGTSDAAMFLPAFLIVSLDVLPFPAMLARRFRLAGRSVWWTLPTIFFTQLYSYVILAWIFGYSLATLGK